MKTISLSENEIADLATAALLKAGAGLPAAQSLARAIAAAEADGIASHGLIYLPTYCLHLECGKVDPTAIPRAESDGAVVRLDAANGFAHPAIDLGFDTLIPMAREYGIAALAIYRSYNCGVLSYHTERLAAAGLLGLGFTNAPASIAGWGGNRPVLGTNPWSLAVPDGMGGVPILIDQSASVVAKSEVMKHQREGRKLPEGWALDAEGGPTTDPEAALKGSMMPAGGYKGVGSALLVEIFAACLTGALPGIEAAPFSGIGGGPPGTGQFFLAVDPQRTAGGLFQERLASVIAAFKADDGIRLPGERRRANRARSRTEGISIPHVLFEQAKTLA